MDPQDEAQAASPTLANIDTGLGQNSENLNIPMVDDSWSREESKQDWIAQAPSADVRLCDDTLALPRRPMLLELQPEDGLISPSLSVHRPRAAAAHHHDKDPLRESSALSNATTPLADNIATKDVVQQSRTDTHARPTMKVALSPSPSSFTLDLPRDANPTTTSESSGRSCRSEVDPTKRENGDVGVDFFDDSVASSASRNIDAIDGDLVMRENARIFPPRMPTSHPFSSEKSKDTAIRKIHSWMTLRASTGSPEVLSNSDRLGRSDVPPEDTGSDVYESSDEDFKPADVENLWRQLVAKRQQVKRVRRLVARTRSRLRDLRPRLHNADNDFMSAIRPVLLRESALRPGSPEPIEIRLAVLQKIRNEVQGLELDYDEAERRLGRKESQLSRIEVRFYNLLGQFEDEADDSDASSIGAIKTDLPLELKGISPELSFNAHPLYTRLEQAVARSRNGEEEYAELWEMKERRENEVWRRRELMGPEGPNSAKPKPESRGVTKPKLSYSEDALAFLEDFPESEIRIKQEVLDSGIEVSRLKKLCEDKGVIPEHPHPDVLAVIYPDSSSVDDIELGDDATILSEHTRLAHPVFPELLSQPDHLLSTELLTPRLALKKAQALPDNDPEKAPSMRAAQKEVSIYNLFNDQDQMTSAKFVNHWILFTLRISPLEVALLFAIFVKRLRVRNIHRWQLDVLRFWDRDGVTQNMDRYQAYHETSKYFTKVATPQRSRAASDTPEKPSRHHERASSIGSAVMRSSTPREPP